MPNNQFYTREAAVRKAAVIIASLVASKLRLLKDPYIPTEFATKDDLEAHEADFNNYTAGGYALAAWAGPNNRTAGGAAELSPLVNAGYVLGVDPANPNTISGWWVEDSTGKVRLVGTLDPKPVLAVDGDVYTWVKEIVEGLNVALSA